MSNYLPIQVGHEIVSICIAKDGQAITKPNQLVIGYCIVTLDLGQIDGADVAGQVTLYTVHDLEDHMLEIITAASIIRANPPKFAEE